MLFKHSPIQKKLMMAMLMTSGAVVLLTCLAFFSYEILTYRRSTISQITTLGRIIAFNSTAALAFHNEEDAREILLALTAEPHITAACLYDDEGKIFAKYPASEPFSSFPEVPGKTGFDFRNSFVEGYLPVQEGEKQVGLLYLKSNMEDMYNRFFLYGLIAFSIILLSFLFAYMLSRALQRGITRPILSLADTAKAISERGDYSVRALKMSTDEIGLLTDAFNQMLLQIQKQNAEISSFNLELEQKNKSLQTLQYVSRVISGELKHKKVVQMITDAVTTLTGAEFGAFYHNKGPSDIEVYQVFANIESNYTYLSKLPAEDGNATSNNLLKPEKILRYNDVSADLRQESPFFNETGAPVITKSLLVSPVFSKNGETVGALYFGHSEEGHFSVNSEEILEGISHQAAIALENAQLYGEANQAKKQVERQRNVLYNVFNYAPSLICLCKGIEFSFEFVNKEFEKHFSGTLSTGKSLRAFLIEKEHTAFLNILDHVFTSGETFNSKEEPVEISVKGEKIVKYFDVIVQALRNEKSQIEGIIAYATDISEQVYARKTIEEFMSVASHELKTPLTTVMAYSELLEEKLTGRGDDDTHYILKMNNNLSRLNSLISDLLDVSRIRSGKLHFNNETINFDEFIQENLENISYTCKTHEIVLKGATHASVSGDKQRLEQAIINIVSNAIKYSPKGGEVLVNLTKENGKVKASFTDYGIGIPTDKMKNLFQRFYRIEEKGTSGLGIGLYITKEIIDRHKGIITVESVYGKGTTFTIALPASG